MKRIFKVQLPLYSSKPDEGALVYDADREIEFILSIGEDLAGAMRGRPKAFFWGEPSEKFATIDFGNEAPFQDW